MYLKRILNLNKLIEKKSYFLFGPRSTGKSSLIAHQLNHQATMINLLRTEVFLLLENRPWELENLIDAQKNSVVVIDEIQKVPMLLNEVHRLIEERQITFLLTGSSAKKLRQRGVNLLAGRAWLAELFPLTYPEIPDFDLDKYLLYGGLPQVVTSPDPVEALDAYVSTYLREEIQAEALIRKIRNFAMFLQHAALTNSQLINFSKLSNDTGIPASTIREYYKILEDTLVGFLIPPWTKTIKRKSISSAKFYFFDIGVRHAIIGTKHIDRNSDIFGQSFEHFIALELRAYLSYKRKKLTLSFWRTTDKHEVDFIIGDSVAIEVKSSDRIVSKHLKGLKTLQDEGVCSQYYCVCFDKTHRSDDGVEIIHWQDFLSKLWRGEII